MGECSSRNPSATARQTTVALDGPNLRLFYDLATGRWSVRAVSERVTVELAGAAAIELVAPDGQFEKRGAATSRLVKYRRAAKNGPSAGSSFRVWRAFADGFDRRTILSARR